ncbi:MAG: type II toxin-antitoxin system HicB family antitoxin [Bacteroidales bacterium]
MSFKIKNNKERAMTKTLKFIVQKEGKYYVSQCLNVDISSFGNTVQEAIDNLNEALDLYFEDKEALFTITPIQETLLGETRIHV